MDDVDSSCESLDSDDEDNAVCETNTRVQSKHDHARDDDDDDDDEERRAAAIDAVTSVAARVMTPNAGVAVTTLNMPASLLSEALKEANELYRSGAMTKGQVAANGVDLPGFEQRGDSVLWLHESGVYQTHASLRKLDEAMQAFVQQLAHEVKPKLALTERTDAMLACYPPGARYAKHVDNPDGDGRDGDGRRIALVYYLNDDDWTDDDAGALRLYHPSSDGYDDVLPRRDVLVVFRADRVAHEVLAPRLRRRWALTTWWCAYEHE